MLLLCYAIHTLLQVTRMFVDYADKDSTYYYNYSALQREECHEELKKILSYCRNKYDNSNSYNIKVLDPNYVKFKRHKRKCK